MYEIFVTDILSSGSIGRYRDFNLPPLQLDYISRLMWQGQIIGNKLWTVAPTPECDNICERFNFTVHAGDIVLLDTRIWYHGTYVIDGNVSLTVTSEYG